MIVVDWNGGDLVARCVDAIARQTSTPRRVVVIDNAGRDPAWRHVRGSRLPIDMVRLPANRGFAAACNFGVSLATDCELVAILNADAFLAPDWLEAMERATAENPGFSSFASRLVCDADPSRLDGTGDVYAVTGLAWRRDHGQLERGHRLEPEEVFGPCAAAALYRRSALEEVGGFDERFFCYFEDVDLALRLRLAGHRSLYVPSAVARHVGSATAVRHSDFSVYHAHRNLVWTFVKGMPTPLLALYAPLHLALNLVSLARFVARGQGRTILRAKRDALLGLRCVWRQRREVQGARRVGAGALRRSMVAGPRALGIGRFQP